MCTDHGNGKVVFTRAAQDVNGVKVSFAEHHFDSCLNDP